MKHILPISLLSLFFLTFSCSDESADVGQNPNPFIGDFFPLSQNNQWDYDVETTDNTANQTNSFQDAITIDSQSSSGFVLSANEGLPANGVMSGILTSGELTNTDTTLLLNGELTLPIEGLNTYTVAIENGALYDLNASSSSILYTKSGEFSETFEGFPLTINYTVTSRQLDQYDTFTVDNTNYNLVTSAEIVLNIEVVTVLEIAGFSQNLPIIDAQDVLVSTSYYAKDIGLIQSDADLGYQLNSSTVELLENAGVDLSQLPLSVLGTNNQVLTGYLIN